MIYDFAIQYTPLCTEEIDNNVFGLSLFYNDSVNYDLTRRMGRSDTDNKALE